MTPCCCEIFFHCICLWVKVWGGECDLQSSLTLGEYDLLAASSLWHQCFVYDGVLWPVCHTCYEKAGVWWMKPWTCEAALQCSCVCLNGAKRLVWMEIVSVLSESAAQPPSLGVRVCALVCVRGELKAHRYSPRELSPIVHLKITSPASLSSYIQQWFPQFLPHWILNPFLSILFCCSSETCVCDTGYSLKLKMADDWQICATENKWLMATC